MFLLYIIHRAPRVYLLSAVFNEYCWCNLVYTSMF